MNKILDWIESAASKIYYPLMALAIVFLVASLLTIFV